MLFQLRKKNIELNDEYNRSVNEKTRLKIDYQRMKKRLEEKIEEDEFEKSCDVSVKSVRDMSVKIDVSVMTIIMTSKKLFDSSIFIDEKNSNIED